MTIDSASISDLDRHRVNTAVAAAERWSEAAILPVVVARSDGYERAEGVAGLLAAVVVVVLGYLVLPLSPVVLLALLVAGFAAGVRTRAPARGGAARVHVRGSPSSGGGGRGRAGLGGSQVAARRSRQRAVVVRVAPREACGRGGRRQSARSAGRGAAPPARGGSHRSGGERRRRVRAWCARSRPWPASWLEVCPGRPFSSTSARASSS